MSLPQKINLDPSVQVDIRAAYGFLFRLGIEFNDLNGDPFDLAGYSAVLEIYNFGQRDKLLQSYNAVISDNAMLFQDLDFRVSRTDAFYQISVISPSGEKNRWFNGVMQTVKGKNNAGNNALEAKIDIGDQVIEVVISAGGGPGGGAVLSVTGDGVDNADPKNPVLSFPTPAEIGAYPDDNPDGFVDAAGAAAAAPVQSVAGKTGAVGLDKSDVGLGNVDNTSDANKPVSTAQQTALDLKLNTGNNTGLQGTGQRGVIVNAQGQIIRFTQYVYDTAEEEHIWLDENGDELLRLKTDEIRFGRDNATSGFLSPQDSILNNNWGIQTLLNQLVSWKLFDSGGPYIRVGVRDGVKYVELTREVVFNNAGDTVEADPIKVIAGAGIASHLMKEIEVPTDSVLTLHITDISVINEDLDTIHGEAVFCLVNDTGTVTNESVDALRYANQHSTIKGTPGAVTSSDTRIDVAISGTTVSVNLVSVENKLISGKALMYFSVLLKPAI